VVLTRLPPSSISWSLEDDASSSVSTAVPNRHGLAPLWVRENPAV